MFGRKAVKKPAPKAAKAPETKAVAAATVEEKQEKPAKRNGLTEAELMRAPASQYMSAEQLAFFRERLRRNAKGAAGKGERHLGASARARARGRSDRPGDDRGRIRARAARPRPRKKAPQENRRGVAPHRRRQLRLLRGDRRAHRHRQADRAADGDAFGRGADPAGAEAETLRRVARWRVWSTLGPGWSVP